MAKELGSQVTQAQFSALPPKLEETLRSAGVLPTDLFSGVKGAEPYTKAGATKLQGEMSMPAMDRSVDGATMSAGADTFVVQNPRAANPTMARAHEMEHVLAAQGQEKPSSLNLKWDELVGKDGARRGEIVDRLLAAGPYLAQKWGLDQNAVKAGYFSPQVAQRDDKHNFLYEQMATLSALEQMSNKRLVDDPYIRKHVLRTPAERETYDALTGLRQSRLDAKDLPPYTRQPEAGAAGLSALAKKFTGK